MQQVIADIQSRTMVNQHRSKPRPVRSRQPAKTSGSKVQDCFVATANVGVDTVLEKHLQAAEMALIPCGVLTCPADRLDQYPVPASVLSRPIEMRQRHGDNLRAPVVRRCPDQFRNHFLVWRLGKQTPRFFYVARLGHHVRLSLRPSLQQQIFDSIVFMIPRIVQRPSGGVNIGIGIGPSIKKQPGHGQIAR